LSRTRTPSPGLVSASVDEEGGCEDDGVSVVVVVVPGVVVVTTGGRVVTGGLVTGGFVTGGTVTGGLVVVVTGGGGTITRNAVPAVPHFVFVDLASSLWLPALVPAGTVAPTEPLEAEPAVAIWAPSSVKMMLTARQVTNPPQEMVTGPPAVAGCGAAVTLGGCWAAAGVATSTVTPAIMATSKPKDRIPSPRIRT